MRKIFIDCGAHDGCSVRKFRKLYDRKKEYMIYSFEVELDFLSFFENISNHTFINKAVWIRDGKKEFYRSKEFLQAGSTLIKKKKSGELDKKHPIIVKTIDFSKWISDTFSKDDYIILKMDIEGAEYQVIPKMIKDGTFSYINELWIEWHYTKIKYPKEKHDNLVKQINIPMKKWDALSTCTLGKRKRNAKPKI
jgi:FkbM family methyltransferase